MEPIRFNLILSAALILPWQASAQVPEFASRLSAGRIAAISDGDFDAQTYATGRLPLRAAGNEDLLTILTLTDGKFASSSLPISNSVTAAPEVLELSSDGRTAFVTERLGQRPERGDTVKDLPPGERLFAVDLTDSSRPRLSDTVDIEANPEALSVSPDGRRVAVVSNTAQRSFVQIVGYRDGRFGQIARFDLAAIGVVGMAGGPRGGITATNVHWHPSGRFLAVNIDTQDRIAFLAVAGSDEVPTLSLWGDPVKVDADPFVGRFTPDGRHYLVSSWGRNFAATDLAGRIPEGPSTINVIRVADLADSGDVLHRRLGSVQAGNSAEGIAISPDGRLVATVNMRGTAFPPDSPRFHRDGSVTLLSLDSQSGEISRIADYPITGSLPEGGAFDLTGEHFLATVFQGHPGAGADEGAGLEVFRVVSGNRPALLRVGRIPMPHGVHHVDLSR